MQFVNSYFLWALGLLAIPVIIHLFQFKRFKRVYFSNVAFLKTIQLESTNRNKIKHLLVLASRLLALLFLILAFAQPFLPAKNNVANTGKKYVSIYIDNSFSMNAIENGSSLLEQAKSTASSITKGYENDDLFQVLTNDFSGKQQRLLSKEEALTLIDGVKISPSSRTWSEVQKRQADVVGRDNSPNQITYLLSDAQKNMGLIEDKTQVKTNYIPFVAQKQANLFIDTCFFYEPIQLLNQKNKLIIKVRNAGSEDAQSIRLSLTINDKSKALSNPSIKAGSYQYDTLSFTIDQVGWNNATIAIEDYPITFDDSYFLAFNVLEKIKVQELKETDAGNYVAAVFANQTEFDFSSSPIGNINYASLATTHFVILSNVQNLSSGLADELKKFVENGGALAVFPSEKADIASLNNFLSSLNAGKFNPLITEDIAGGEINLSQKLVRDLFDKIPSNLKMPMVKKHYPYVSGNIPTETIFSLKNNNKSIVAARVTNGYLYLFTSPLNGQQNEMVVHSMFAPLLFKMAIISAKSSAIAATIGSKTPIEILANTVKKERAIRMIGKGIEFIPEQYTIGNKTYLQPKENVQEAGFFKALADNKADEASIALNYDRKESILDYTSKEALLQSNPNLTIINTTGMEAVAISKNLARGTPLWKYCLMLALLFLGVETALLVFWKK
jgi:hypothetical protein